MKREKAQVKDDGWRIPDELWVRIQLQQNICLDKGYDYKITNALVLQYGYAPHIRHRGEDALAYRKPGKPARRWVIERTNNWMKRFRRVLIRGEKKIESSVAMIEFAFALIIFKKTKAYLLRCDDDALRGTEHPHRLHQKRRTLRRVGGQLGEIRLLENDLARSARKILQRSAFEGKYRV